MAIDQAALNALTAAWGAQKAGLDDSANRYRINYNTTLRDLKKQRTKNTATMGVNMADRGLQQSGVAAKELINQNQDYASRQQRLSQQQALNLGTIARKRLEADVAYKTQAPFL